MKKTILILFMIFTGNLLFAQNDSLQVKENNYAKNTVYFEFGGNGGFYSINYDRMIKEKKNQKVSIRGGCSLWILNSGNDLNPLGTFDFETIRGDELYHKSFIIPVEINYFFGKMCFFEISGGLTGDIHMTKNLYGSRLYLFTRVLGFRYQKENGGFFFRAGLVPSFKIFLYKNEFLFDPFSFFYTYISIDFGYTFKNKYKK